MMMTLTRTAQSTQSPDQQQTRMSECPDPRINTTWQCARRLLAFVDRKAAAAARVTRSGPVSSTAAAAAGEPGSSASGCCC